MILLATGLSEAERKLESMLENVHRCHHRSVLLEVAAEIGAKTVVLSPCLPGEQSIVKDIVLPLREKGVSVVFLPGDEDMPDAREWMVRLIRFGVYSYVYDPVTPEKIVFRINNPGNINELPADVVRRAFEADVPLSDPVGLSPARAAQAKPAERQEEPPAPEPKGEPLSGEPERRRLFGVSRFISALFPSAKPGVIAGGDFREEDWEGIEDMVVAPDACDAVVIPASWGLKAVRDFRRNPRFRAVPLIVLRGNKEFLRAGADVCVRRISPEVIEEAVALARRYRELWQRAEFDSLTGLYKKDFLLEWIKEQERKAEPCFSLAVIDIDHFKSFNDTYGHQAGDAVLASFGAFLKSQTRSTDVAARYGGEEFVVGLPNTPAAGARVLIDRLREEWSKREITLPTGEVARCTFSAGVAEYERGADVIAEADRFLYEAKRKGRNRVEGAEGRRLKVLLLGQMPIGQMLLEQGIELASDPSDAAAVVSDLKSFAFAPSGKPLVVLGTSTIADFAVRKSRPDARIVTDEGEIPNALRELFEKPKPKNLKVLPGGRSEKGQTLALHSAVYVVCPSRPGLAGEVAARLAKSAEGCALVCAAPESTGALAIGIPKEDLVCSDWRIPGSDAPVKWGGVMVWPVDPFKFLNVRDVSAHALVEQIKPKFSLVVVDCAGNLEIASRAPKSDAVIVLHREGDAADAATSYWLKSYAGSNVTVMSPSEVPDVLEAGDGFVLVKKSGSALETRS